MEQRPATRREGWSRPTELPPASAQLKPPFAPCPAQGVRAPAQRVLSIRTSPEVRAPNLAPVPPPATPRHGPSPPRARARGGQPRPVPESPTGAGAPKRRSVVRRPPPPSSALSLQTAASRRVPGAAERGPAVQSALTWKCSAIFPGGGAGRLPRAPEGRERRRAPRKPQPPAGSLRRWLAHTFVASAARPLRLKRWTGRGLMGRGDGGGARRAGLRGRSLGNRESQPPQAGKFEPIMLPQVGRNL